MAGLNFTDALAKMKRRAQLQGRPISQQEVEGVASGAGADASDRLANLKQISLQKTELDNQAAARAEAAKQNEEDRAAAEKASTAGTTVSGATAGAMIGAEYGGAAGGWWGAGIGAVVGYGASKCIIISACTSKDSYEVNISREFRDKYMSFYHLGGYYALAHRIAPLIEKSNFLKLITKKFLIDRLVDYGEWILEYKSKRQLKTSRIVTVGFLRLCAAIGMRINVQPYVEAHR